MTTIASATPIKVTLTDITACTGCRACQIALLSLALLATCSVTRAQTLDSAAEIQQLKALVTAQQKALEPQQAQMQMLQKQLTEQQQTIISIVERTNGTPQYLPAVDRSLDLRAGDYNLQAAPQNLPASAQAPEDLTLEQQEAEQSELQRGTEIADPKPDTPAVKLGPAKIRFTQLPVSPSQN